MTIVPLATGGSSGAPRLVAEYVVGADPCGHKTTVTPVLTDASGCRWLTGRSECVEASDGDVVSNTDVPVAGLSPGCR